MLCIFGAWLSDFLFVKNRRSYDIAHVAKLSFLAVTRNLMVGTARCCLCICAGIEIRSLVQARDDAIVNTVLLFCGCSLFKDRRT